MCRKRPREETPLTTLIFDIDDTLYDVGSGFTAHRNGDAVFEFMQAKLKFESAEAAKLVRDVYFEKYHATVKALTVAEAEGRLPAGAHFDPADLAEWWSTRLAFSKFLSVDAAFVHSLQRCPLRLVAFTNAPRRYGVRVLETLGLRGLFPDVNLFAVEDVMPYPKPHRKAFQKVLASLGADADECCLVEDSMKNIRGAKAVGMRTVLVRGRPASDPELKAASEATKPGDRPDASDPAVDAVVDEVRELETTLPGLWRPGSDGRLVFGTTSARRFDSDRALGTEREAL